MKHLIPPIAKGTLVGVRNCVGAYRLLRRTAPNFYEVDFKGQTVLMPRSNLVHPLPPGRYLLNGKEEVSI